MSFNDFIEYCLIFRCFNVVVSIRVVRIVYFVRVKFYYFLKVSLIKDFVWVIN